MSGSLPLLNRPKQSIVQDLIGAGFQTLTVETSEIISEANVFDCLLNSQISSLTKESIDRLQNETKKIEADHLSLLSTDPLLVWLSDLLSLHDKFSTELNKTPSPLKNNSNSHHHSFKKKEKKKRVGCFWVQRSVVVFSSCCVCCFCLHVLVFGVLDDQDERRSELVEGELGASDSVLDDIVLILALDGPLSH